MRRNKTKQNRTIQNRKDKMKDKAILDKPRLDRTRLAKDIHRLAMLFSCKFSFVISSVLSIMPICYLADHPNTNQCNVILNLYLHPRPEPLHPTANPYLAPTQIFALALTLSLTLRHYSTTVTTHSLCQLTIGGR